MGVLSRINDIIRSNLNDLVSKAENPEKLLTQAILDMETHLRKARQQVLDTIASEKTLEKKRLLVLEASRRWERRAELALRANDEELARQALLRKEDQDGQDQTLEEQVKVQREYVGALRQSLVALEERLRDAKSRKDALIVRAKAARARKKVAEALAPALSSKRSAEVRAFDTFERMEDRIVALEAQAEAYLEMGRPEDQFKEEPVLEARFVAIERDVKVNVQLEKLKQQIAGKTKGAKQN